jgi:hypothetical protein
MKQQAIDTAAIRAEFDQLMRRGTGITDALRLVAKIPALLDEIDRLRRQPRLFEVGK